jgi:hypothetical protein
MKREALGPAVWRVTTQYRVIGGFVYELEREGTALAVHVSQHRDDDGPGDWRVEAHNGRGADAVVIAESGPTASEALQKVVRAWGERARAFELPALDWDTVATALVNVRAI